MTLKRPELIAFIPVRRGSKRLPGKNIRMLHGRPLVEWTIEFARQSSLFSRIVINTDEPAVAGWAGQAGCETIDRRADLAHDFTTVLEVLLHTGEALSLADDSIVALLLVTAPLRVASDLTEGLALFDRHNRRRTVVSVTRTPMPPELLWHLDESGSLRHIMTSPGPVSTRKQDHRPAYQFNDILVLDRFASFRMPGRDLFGPDPIALLVPPERCMPIDEMHDFRLAELMHPPEDERVRARP